LTVALHAPIRKVAGSGVHLPPRYRKLAVMQFTTYCQNKSKAKNAPIATVNTYNPAAHAKSAPIAAQLQVAVNKAAI